jgi:hypothetical protein
MASYRVGMIRKTVEQAHVEVAAVTLHEAEARALALAPRASWYALYEEEVEISTIEIIREGSANDNITTRSSGEEDE